jgi:hypothetical protein
MGRFLADEGRFNETQNIRRWAAERPAQIQNAPVTLLLTGWVTWGARQFLILTPVPPASRRTAQFPPCGTIKPRLHPIGEGKPGLTRGTLIAVLIGRLGAQSNARRAALVTLWWPSHSGFLVHARNVQTKLEKASAFGCRLDLCWYNSLCKRKPGAADNDPRRQSLRRT